MACVSFMGRSVGSQRGGDGGDQCLHLEWFFDQRGVWGETEGQVEFALGGRRAKDQRQFAGMGVRAQQFENVQSSNFGQVQIKYQEFER